MTLKLLKTHEAVLQSVYPGFSADAEAVLGTCIDTFHKNPSYQRGILGDANNLPYSADIQVGPLVFKINVSALRDLDGQGRERLRAQDGRGARGKRRTPDRNSCLLG